MPEADIRATLAELTAQLPGGGEHRQGQVAMAEAVASAIDTNTHLFVQAGTGTGKSLAYLVPAALSGQKVVVATATKALQDQLALRDLPFLGRHLDVDWTVLKGRNNYLCLQRVAELRNDRQLALDGVAADDAELDQLVAWADRTDTGDRADLDVEPSEAAWAAVSVGPNECPGAARCPNGSECFSERARWAAGEATVVVVNTHLYGMHLKNDQGVLPAHDVLVVDEAHQLEEVISATAGFELSAGRARRVARAVRAIVADDDAVTDRIDRAADRLADQLAPSRGQRVSLDHGTDLGEAVDQVRDAVERAVQAMRNIKDDHPDPDVRGRAARARRLTADLIIDIDLAFSLDDASVAWVGGRSNAPVLTVAPLDVGQVLRPSLWDTVPTVVLTSATIPANLPERLGLAPDEHTSLDVGSPFDYESQSLLYCAAGLPDVRADDYPTAMHAELEQLIVAAGGRTLALFTSWRAMQAAAEALRPQLPWAVFAQGDLPKPALLEAFSSDPESCLFATMSFWQGVDIPGDALTLVTIDRLPFPRPDDPLLEARRERLGPRAFNEIDLPRAAMLLAQGTGRLIRTRTDRGVVAVLDRRLAASRSYRWQLVAALPPYRRTKDPGEVQAFLRSVRDQTVA